MTLPVNHPFLIADTPRAGRLNHRTIVPLNIAAKNETIRDFVDRARSAVEKKNFRPATDYLAVSREVEQIGQEKRVGTEVLILAGIDSLGLSPTELVNIRGKLEGRMLDLESLVQKGIDWRTKDATDNLILHRRELNDWSEEFSGLPVPNQGSQKSNPPPPSIVRFCSIFSRHPLLLLLFVLTATIAIGASVLKKQKRRIDPAPNSKTDVTSTPKAAEMEERRVLGKLAEKWGMSEEELEKQLWQAIGKSKTPFISSDLYRQSEVTALLAASKSTTETPGRFVIIGTDPNRKKLEAFDSCLAPNNIVVARTYLKELDNSFLRLREACEPAAAALPSTPLPFLKLAMQSRATTESAMAAQYSTLQVYTLNDADMAARVMGWLQCAAAEAVGIHLSKPTARFSEVNWDEIDGKRNVEKRKPEAKKFDAIYRALEEWFYAVRGSPSKSQ